MPRNLEELLRGQWSVRKSDVSWLSMTREVEGKSAGNERGRPERPKGER